MTEKLYLMTKELNRFTCEVLQATGVAPDDARTTADCMLMAHLRGFDTHGLPCLHGYVECLEQNRFNPKPNISIEKATSWSFRIDADNGLGHIAAHRAMTQTLEAAHEFGVGGAVVRRSNHFGAASAYSLMALEHDCVGMVTSNASAVTAPFGAAQPILGTNPLSVAVPSGELPPFVIDMATSEGARKKIRLALERGESLPPGWAMDEQGNPTTDPAKALAGVMLPFGGVKGSAITILLDILSGVLSGANFGGDVLSVFTNQERESGNGHFFLVFSINAFMPAKTFKSRMDEELARIRSLRPAKGFTEVIYPGYREHFIQTERLKKGIPLDINLLEKVAQIGHNLGVERPW
jgi:LDH2 family malate/lactate/ureidoglycolate dehydrogenase